MGKKVRTEKDIWECGECGRNLWGHLARQSGTGKNALLYCLGHFKSMKERRKEKGGSL